MGKLNLKNKMFKETIVCFYKRIISMILLTSAITCLMAQNSTSNNDEDSVSYIKSEKYKINPIRYLKYIDKSIMPNNILIDRTIFRTDIGLFNGKSKVKTCDYYIWKRLYNSLKYSCNDSNYYPPVNIVRETAISMANSENHMVPIGIINMKYSKVSKNAIESGLLKETDSCMLVEKTNADIFSSKQICAATTFDHVLHGPDVKFLISPMFIFLNDTTEKIKGISIDFGDGKGFINTLLNEPFVVNFGHVSKYIIAKIKITYSNSNRADKKDKTRFAHFTFLYSGTDAVPEPGIVSKKSNLKSTPPTPDKTIYLISGSTEGATGDIWRLTQTIHDCWWVANGLWRDCHPPQTNHYYDPYFLYPTGTKPDTYEYSWERIPEEGGNYDIEANILWGSGNSSGMLRKSIIISDAFDPGNTRNYYATHMEFDTDPYKFDPRGLYQILNGDKSAWTDVSDNGATLAQDLIRLGYDIVFVNYKSGDGDIPENAKRLEGFLDYMNKYYRDNQTEEFILMGPSMGGIITRYCLTSMEQYSPPKEHHVKLWFSFDSPQEGASIPLGLQYGVNYLQNRTIINWMSSGSLSSSLGSLNSLAAQQMLIQHFEYANPEPKDNTRPKQSVYNYTSGNTAFSNFYSILRQKGYPRYSKNIAISNGGTQLLYPDESDNVILEFHSDGVALTRGSEVNATGYRQSNDASTSHQIFHGNFVDGLVNDYDINLTSGAIGFDNAPGGYNTSLYTFNYTSNDRSSHSDGKEWRRKATFMPTVTAFGIVPTNDNVHKTWQDISPSETPFDDFKGTSTDKNEEHVRVSANTSKWLKDYLEIQRKNIQKPYPRTTTYAETESKPCMYTATQSITLGGESGSSFVIKSGADINVIAPSITFKPGFTVERGATLHATPATVINGSQKSAPEISAKPPVSYLQPSPYNNKVYDYSEYDLPKLVDNNMDNQTLFTIYPNPVVNFLIIEYSGLWEGDTKVKISSIMGQTLISMVYRSTFKQSVDLSNLPSGLYLVTIATGNQTSCFKIVKKLK